MKASFTAISRITIGFEPNDSRSSHLLATDLRLEVSKNVEKQKYLVRDLPTREGMKPLSQALIQGLIANIKMGHEKGFWNESDHLRYIIDELHRGFVTNADVTESYM